MIALFTNEKHYKNENTKCQNLTDEVSGLDSLTVSFMGYFDS
jgi:hypothetical protein